jgi:ectoine hydroxylase-related dioxygenase (phytanoyl-CoA dioxygenase family)
MTQSTAIAPSLLKQFETDGYIILKNVLPPSTVESVKKELQATVDQHADVLLHQRRNLSLLENEPFETRFHKLYAKCMDVAPSSLRGDALHKPGYFPMLFDSKVLDIVETILGPEIRIYPNYTVRPKFPDDPKTLVLWHQDAAYTDQVKTAEGVDNLKMVNVWSPLVPATVENGCMQFIPGTHKLGLVPHVQKQYYLEIAPDQLEPRLAQAVDIELDPGDIVLFSNLLFHVGRPNKTDKIRWSLDWRYQDAAQPTLRAAEGHIARSRKNPNLAIKNSAQWAQAKANFI